MNDPASKFIRLFFNIPEPTSFLHLDSVSPDQFGRIRMYNILEEQRRQ